MKIIASKYRSYSLLLLFTLTFSLSCKKKEADAVESCETFNINLFSIEQDRQLGAQVDSQLVAQYKDTILDKAKYAKAYEHLERIKNKILASGKVQNKDKFDWEVKIINQDVLNAFCTPGGYIYVYTGIIKYLDNEDDFAGVLGHEIAHADQRHSTKAMTRDVGVQTLLSIVLGSGTAAQLGQVAASLVGLKYSRCHEREADDYSVNYLSGTSYKCNGAASFFAKMGNENSPPEFLSTHPNPGNRVVDINARATLLGCQTTASGSTITAYQDFKNSLP